MKPKSDPDKPCNRAFIEGLEAQRAGKAESDCPHNQPDAYSTYLRAFWLNGFRSPDGVNHHSRFWSEAR